jgi:hypothetical protein
MNRGYIVIESGWTPKECPLCKKMATSHASLFSEPPPRAPHKDKRKAIGEIFIHANSIDCIVQYAESTK